MRKKGLITVEDFDSLMGYTERPRCEGLVPHDYETPEERMKKEKSLRQHYDLYKEGRQMKKASRKGKGKETSQGRRKFHQS